MKWSFQKINLLKLSGVSTVIGIDLTDGRARVVELTSHGGIFNKFQSKFRVKKHFTVEFVPNSAIELKASLLKKELESHKITTRYASSAIQTHGVRVVIAEIPLSVIDIDSWIHDNFEKLLKLPIPLKDVSIGYEILSTGTVSRVVEITFVRKSDILLVQTLFSLVGLTLLSLSGGVRDALNPLLYTKEFLERDIVSFVYFIEQDVIFSEFENKKRVRTHHVEKNSINLETSKDLLMAGEIDSNITQGIKPFSIPSEYTLAVGCALKGFIGELHPTNFITPELSVKRDDIVNKSLFQRTVILCGSFILGILFLQMFASFYIDKRSGDIDTKLLDSGLNYTELTILEKQNAELKNELKKNASSEYRSNIAKVFHEIATLTPNGVWLYKIRTDLSSKPKGNVVITGYASSGENIAEFLKRCGSSSVFEEVRLIRSGMPLQNENMSVVEKRVTNPTTFELQGTLRQ